MEVLSGEDIAMFHPDGHAGCHLVRPKMGVTYGEERDKDALEHATLYQPSQEAKHVGIFILPDAVVHLEAEVLRQLTSDILYMRYCAVDYLDRHIGVVEMIFQTVVHKTLREVAAARYCDYKV